MYFYSVPNSGTQKRISLRESVGGGGRGKGGCQTCSPSMLSMPCSDIMKVHGRERLSQPRAGGITENRKFELNLKEKIYQENKQIRGRQKRTIQREDALEECFIQITHLMMGREVKRQGRSWKEEPIPSPINNSI